MKNFIFKSTDADFKKIIQLIDTRLDLHGKNILYITYRVDSILKELKTLSIDKGLQKQVDEYFDETSHQTDSPGTNTEGID